MKICLCITEDWYLKSHYLPLLSALIALSRDVIVLTRVGKHGEELEAMGARVIDFDWNRTSMNPAGEVKTIMRLIKILRREKPDSLHLVAMKPITLGGLAFRVSTVSRVFVHLSGVGFLVVTDALKTNIIKQMVMRQVSALLSRKDGWLFAQNPDDCTLLARFGARFGQRLTMVGGAGVDPEYFTVLPAPSHPIPRVAYVGRMLWPKGVHVLIEAQQILAKRGVALAVDLYGRIDEGNPQAISRAQLEQWNEMAHITWHGQISDVRKAWSSADFAVVPSTEREGTPRSMLEAAACGRALIVTDVSGSRHFCSHNIEGLVVPPNDAAALAKAMEMLLVDEPRRTIMGKAARARVLEGYTAEHYQNAVIGAYRTVFGEHIKTYTNGHSQ